MRSPIIAHRLAGRHRGRRGDGPGRRERRRSSPAPPTISTHRPPRPTTASTSPTSTPSRPAPEHDARPERGRAPHPCRRQGRGVPHGRAVRAQGRHATRTAGRTSPIACGSPRRSPTATAARPRPTWSAGRPAPAAARNVWTGKVVADGPDHRLQARASHCATSRAAARPSPASATIRSSSTCPGFVEFKNELLGGIDRTCGTLLGGFTGTDTFAGTNVLSIAIRVPERQARRHRQLDRRLRDHVRPVQRRLEADRPHGPAGDQHRVQRPASCRRLGTTTALEKDAFNAQRPTQRPRDHDRQRRRPCSTRSATS